MDLLAIVSVLSCVLFFSYTCVEGRELAHVSNTEEFDCSRCWEGNGNIEGSLTWCACCAHDCDNIRAYCLEQEGFCQTKRRCSELSLCDPFKEGEWESESSSTKQNNAIQSGKQKSAVIPLLTCVETSQDQKSWIAHFGYDSKNTKKVEIPAGFKNGFEPIPRNRGQPTSFFPGLHEDAFQVEYDTPTLTWRLEGPDKNAEFLTAQASSQRCSPEGSECPGPSGICASFNGVCAKFRGGGECLALGGELLPQITCQGNIGFSEDDCLCCINVFSLGEKTTTSTVATSTTTTATTSELITTTTLNDMCGRGCLEKTEISSESDSDSITYTFDNSNSRCEVSHFVLEVPACVNPENIIVTGCSSEEDFNVGPCGSFDEINSARVIKIDIDQECGNSITVKMPGSTGFETGPIGIKGGRDGCSTCRTDVHSCSQTGRPTGEPTKVPTEEPTGEPTKVPTEEPTKEPTRVPTKEPTGKPTKVPTKEPTKGSTLSPTPGPTDSDTGCIGYDRSSVFDFEEFQTGETNITTDDFSVETLSNNCGAFSVMIFDSDNPTGGDTDLGTPNQDFGGPGIGSAGSMNGPGPNFISEGKILILSENGNSNLPNDCGRGGSFKFNFAQPQQFSRVVCIDSDDGSNNFFEVFLGNDLQLSKQVPPIGENSRAIVDLEDVTGDMIVVSFSGSGSVASIVPTSAIEECPCSVTNDCDDPGAICSCNGDCELCMLSGGKLTPVGGFSRTVCLPHSCKSDGIGNPCKSLGLFNYICSDGFVCERECQKDTDCDSDHYCKISESGLGKNGICSICENGKDCCETFLPTPRPTDSVITDSPTKEPTKEPTPMPTTKEPTDSPTRSPTKEPTKNPTKSPTREPTDSPTVSPTESPTKSPTVSPTKRPTRSPTESPTESPTKSPTRSPTRSPTESPTEEPTKNPTRSPTVSPTKNPTASPTKSGEGACCIKTWCVNGVSQRDCDEAQGIYSGDDVTCDQAQCPTLSPTMSPSESPTESPTGSPTGSPTENPTTVSPTSSPTPRPTSDCETIRCGFNYAGTCEEGPGCPHGFDLDPSGISICENEGGEKCNVCCVLTPTSSPTKRPTGRPTKQPTKRPTMRPTTKTPTPAPTFGEGACCIGKHGICIDGVAQRDCEDVKGIFQGIGSDCDNATCPTSSPTESPTGSPTNSPTASPTQIPTASPTASPTQIPTASPTNSPTKSPTTSPTNSPTTSPTKSPTKSPTETPTEIPTSSPTVTPECLVDTDCRDQNVCTIDKCDDVTFTCTNIPIQGCCLWDKECDDRVPCTIDECINNMCSNELKDCTDGLNCTIDSCDQRTGECVFTKRNCTDENLCTVDRCSEESGCFHRAKDCDDQNECTIDKCDPLKGCLYEEKICNDHDECTIDECDPWKGCQFTRKNCDDENKCTIDSCDAGDGQCLNRPKDCNDHDECTLDICDSATGDCLHFPKMCDDQNKCTLDSCDSETGNCIFSKKSCEDDDLCTVDTCDPMTGHCHHNDKMCNDFNKCTDDSCNSKNGKCVFKNKNCNDHDVCTKDSCINGKCMNYPIPNCCITDDDCTVANSCTNSTCDTETNQCSFVAIPSCCTMTGDCDDQNKCTTDVCENETGKCLHWPKPCDDFNECTFDSCDSETGECIHDHILIDDENNCTIDKCDSKTGLVEHIIQDCVDEDKCTVDTCDNGVCFNEPKDCDDHNNCTTDSCDPSTGHCVNVPVVCDDGNLCTDDTCVDGLCQFTRKLCNDLNKCTIDRCEPLTGQCTNVPKDCRDSDPCTIDECDARTGRCVNTLKEKCCRNDTECHDSNVCTVDICEMNQCWHRSFEYCCQKDADCGDDDACTLDSCDPESGKCTNKPVVCNDEDECTLDSCVNGECLFIPKKCDDQNKCTLDSCVDGQCVNEQIVCNDNNTCTIDTCTNGQCLFQEKDCDDYNECTLDTCDDGKCIHKVKNCDDQNKCTTDECVDGTCRNTLVKDCCIEDQDCDNWNVCTLDKCNTTTNTCEHTPVPECCQLNSECRDRDLCTIDLCDPRSGKCSHIDLVCDDYNECTLDSCDSNTGKCIFTEKVCDDYDPCTIDDCDSKTGECAHVPKICDDHNLCTIDTCEDGKCISRKKDCSDEDPCTVDQCVEGKCEHRSKICEDNNDCTVDKCVAGDCLFTQKDCDDQNKCTMDTCFAFGGCQYSNITCDDDNPCTSDTCDPDSGCHHTEITDCCLTKADCDDDDICTFDLCEGHKCWHRSIPQCCVKDEQCDDYNRCTTDRCDHNQCKHDIVAGCCLDNDDCEDYNICTDDICRDHRCKYVPNEECLPTESPTTSPSQSPTSSPTTSPSQSPTTSPTTSPSQSPTTSPTTSPSQSPTTSPTTSPSQSPTTSPTDSPTLSPTTASPSKSPTKEPTLSPTTDKCVPECGEGTNLEGLVINVEDFGNGTAKYTFEKQLGCDPKDVSHFILLVPDCVDPESIEAFGCIDSGVLEVNNSNPCGLEQFPTIEGKEFIKLEWKEADDDCQMMSVTMPGTFISDGSGPMCVSGFKAGSIQNPETSCTECETPTFQCPEKTTTTTVTTSTSTSYTEEYKEIDIELSKDLVYPYVDLVHEKHEDGSYKYPKGVRKITFYPKYLKFDITIINKGIVSANGVVVEDRLPKEFKLDTVNHGPDGWSATQGSFDPNTNKWTLGDSLEPGESETLSLYVIFSTEYTDIHIQNVAEVIEHDEPDIDSQPGNNMPKEDDQDSEWVMLWVPRYPQPTPPPEQDHHYHQHGHQHDHDYYYQHKPHPRPGPKPNDHQCHKFKGCDGVYGSCKQLDECGVCDGYGDTCCSLDEHYFQVYHDEIEVVQKPKCTMQEKESGVYEFTVGGVLPEHGSEHMVMLVSFDNFESGTLREVGTCDNRVPHDHGSSWHSLWGKYQWNGWKMSTDRLRSQRFYKRSFTLEELRDECQKSNGNGVLISQYGHGEVSYGGTLHLIVMDPKDIYDEKKGYTVYYKVPCSFSIHLDSEGSTAVEYSAQNRIKYDSQWIGNHCERYSNTFYSVIQTCIDKKSVYHYSNQYDEYRDRYEYDKHHIYLGSPNIVNYKEEPALEWMHLKPEEQYKCKNLHYEKGQNVPHSDWCCQHWYLVSHERKQYEFVGTKHLEWKVYLDGHLQGNIAPVTTRVSYNVINPCPQNFYTESANYQRKLAKRDLESFEHAKGQQLDSALIAHSQHNPFRKPFKGIDEDVKVFFTLFKDDAYSVPYEHNQPDSGFYDNEKTYALLYIGLPYATGLSCYAYTVVIEKVEICIPPINNEGEPVQLLEPFDPKKSEETGCNTPLKNSQHGPIKRYLVFSSDNKDKTIVGEFEAQIRDAPSNCTIHKALAWNTLPVDRNGASYAVVDVWWKIRERQYTEDQKVQKSSSKFVSDYPDRKRMEKISILNRHFKIHDDVLRNRHGSNLPKYYNDYIPFTALQSTSFEENKNELMPIMSESEYPGITRFNMASGQNLLKRRHALYNIHHIYQNGFSERIANLAKKEYPLTHNNKNDQNRLHKRGLGFDFDSDFGFNSKVGLKFNLGHDDDDDDDDHYEGHHSSHYGVKCRRGYHFVSVLEYCVKDYSPKFYSNISFWIVVCVFLILILILAMNACMTKVYTGKKIPKKNFLRKKKLVPRCHDDDVYMDNNQYDISRDTQHTGHGTINDNSTFIIDVNKGYETTPFTVNGDDSSTEADTGLRFVVEKDSSFSESEDFSDFSFGNEDTNKKNI